MNKLLHLLQIEDSEADAKLIVYILRRAGYDVDARRVETAAAMKQAFEDDTWDAIIADYSLPQFDVTGALEILRESGRDIPFIVVSGAVGEDVAVETMRLGAHDYLLKNSMTRLAAAVEREIGNARMRAEQREREERLRKELERSNADLQAYAYSISHDLREPLRVISCYADLVQRRCGGQLNDAGRELLDAIAAGAQRMGEMLTGLLKFSRADEDKQELLPIDTHLVLNEALDSLAVEIRNAGARITAGPMPVLLAWEHPLEQVFLNLIGNALKYRKPEEAPRIAISAERRGEEWQFSVVDNGIGFDMADARRIFELFQRLDPADRHGTGIGLATSRRIVERHGGRIWAESAPGKGAAFHFTIPSPLLPAAIPEDGFFFEQGTGDEEMAPVPICR